MHRADVNRIWGYDPFFFSFMLVKMCANIPSAPMNTRRKSFGENSYIAQPAKTLTSQQLGLTLGLYVNYLALNLAAQQNHQGAV